MKGYEGISGPHKGFQITLKKGLATSLLPSLLYTFTGHIFRVLQLCHSDLHTLLHVHVPTVQCLPAKLKFNTHFPVLFYYYSYATVTYIQCQVSAKLNLYYTF